MNRNIAKRVWAWIMVACMLLTCIPTSLAEEVVLVPVEEQVEAAPVAEIEEIEPEIVEPEPEVEEVPAEPVADETPVEPEAPAEAEAPAEPEEDHPVIAEAEAPAEEAAPELFADVPATEDAVADAAEIVVPDVEAISVEEAYALLLNDPAATKLEWTGGKEDCPDHTNKDDATKVTVDTPIEASCANKTPGLKRYVCKTCGATAYEQIEWKHTFTQIKPNTPAIQLGNCGTPAKYVSICDVCGAEGELEVKPSGKHTYETQTVTPGDCLHKPQVQEVCKVCGFKNGDPKDDPNAPEPSHQWVKDVQDGDWECKTAENFKWICAAENCPGKPEEDSSDATGERDIGGGVKKAIKVETNSTKAHKFGADYVEREATCTQKGGKVKVCEVCGAEEFEEGQSTKELGHLTDGKWYPVEGTHGADHYETQICTRPGCSGITAADGTEYYRKCSSQSSTWTQSAEHPETCKQGKTTDYECKSCGYKETIVTPGSKPDPTKHKFEATYEGNEPVEGAAPTCVNPGIVRQKCIYCGEYGTGNDAYAQVGRSHHWVKDTVQENPPTCNLGGTITYTCDNPGCPGYVTGDPKKADSPNDYVVESTTGPAKRVEKKEHTRHSYNTINNEGHLPEVPDEHKDPTCIEDGYDLYICKWCQSTGDPEQDELNGHTYHKAIPADPKYHKVGTENVVVQATCNEPAMAGKQCSICKKIVKDKQIVNNSKPLGHLWHLINPEDKPKYCGEDWTRKYVCMRDNCDGYQLPSDPFDDETFRYIYEMYNGEHDYEMGMIQSDRVTEDGKAYAEATGILWDNGDPNSAGFHDFYDDDSDPKGEHLVTVPATCEEGSYKAYKCKYCDAVNEYDKRDEQDDPLGHDWTAWEEGTDAQDPYNFYKHFHVRFCKRSGCKYARDSKDWDVYYPIEEDEEGNLQTNPVDGGFDLATEEVYVEENCLQPAHTHTECAAPGNWCDWEHDEIDEGLIEDYDPSKLHTHAKGLIWDDPSQKATCAKPGKGKYICDLCGQPFGDDIEVPGHHDWVLYDGTYDGKASCTAAGEIRYVCQTPGCNGVKSTLDKDKDDEGHTIEYKTIDGTFFKIVKYEAALGHTFGTADEQGEYKGTPVIQPGDCGHDGLKTWTCERCGATATKKIPATGKHTPDKSRPKLVEKTCLTDGYMTYYCSVCDELITEGEGVTPLANGKATGHKFSTVEIIPEGADCTAADGFYKIKVCTNENCPGYDVTWTDNGEKFDTKADGEVDGKAYQNGTKVEHQARHLSDSSSKIEITEEDCENDCTIWPGTWYKCKACGTLYQSGGATPQAKHQFWNKEDTADNGADINYGWVKDPATSGKTHKHIRTCLKCGLVQHEDDKNLPDDANAPKSTEYWESTTEQADCTDPLRTVYTCKICKETYTENSSSSTTTDPTKHVFDDETNDETPVPPTCTTPGVKREVCDKCGAYGEYYQVDAEHMWGEYVTTKAPTCIAAGDKTHFCQNPNCPLKGKLDAPNVWTKNDAYKGLAFKTETGAVKATGHSYEQEGDPSAEGVVTSTATCTTAGERTYTCTWCDEKTTDHTKTEAIPKLAHVYVTNELFPGDCENAGRSGGRVCQNCGQADPANPGQQFGAAQGHRFKLVETKDPGDCTKGIVKVYVCESECPGWVAANHSDLMADNGKLPASVPSDITEADKANIDTVKYTTNADGKACMTVTFKGGTHAPGGTTQTVKPDCEHGELLITICPKCGKESSRVDLSVQFPGTEAYKPLGHDWDDGGKLKNDGWVAVGDTKEKHTHTRTCHRPGCLYNEAKDGPATQTASPASGGNKNDGTLDWKKTTVPANCKEKAKTVFECQICGYSYETIDETSKPNDSHVFNRESEAKNDEHTIEATCTTPGVYREVCDVCGEAYGNYYQVDAGHDFSVPVGDVIPATCEHPKQQAYACSRGDQCPGDGTHTPAQEVRVVEGEEGKLAPHKAVQSMQSYWIYTFCTACGKILDADEEGKPYVNQLFDGAASRFGTCVKATSDGGKVDTAHSRHPAASLRMDPPTETLTGGWFCTACNQILTGHLPIASCKHTSVDHSKPSDDLVSPATCVAAAQYNYLCPECNKTVALSCGTPDTKTGHNYVASVDEDGNIATYDVTKRTAHTEGNCVDRESSTYTCTLCPVGTAGKTVTLTGEINAANHKSEAEKAAQAATCTSKGHEAGKFCSACNQWTSGAVTPATGHKWKEIPDYQAPDPADPAKGIVNMFICQNENCPGYDAAVEATDYLDPMPAGYQRAMGSDGKGKAAYWTPYVNCDHAELDAKIEADGYDPTTDKDATLAAPATCVKGATYNITCPACNTKQPRTIGDPDTDNGHDYVKSVAEDGTITYDDAKGEVTTKADCVTPKVTLYTCSACGESVANHTKSVTGEVDPAEHKSPTPMPEQPATCVAAGHHVGVFCEACENWVFGGGEIPIDTENGHNYDAGVVTTVADCVTEEVKTYTCQNEGCEEKNAENGYQKTETGKTDPTNHKDKAGIPERTTDVEGATCTSTVKTTTKYRCSECHEYIAGKEEVEENQILGHLWSEQPTSKVEGNCTVPGSETYTCTREDCPGHKAADGTDADGENEYGKATKTVETGTVATNHADYEQKADPTTAKAATCTTPGKEADVKCEGCHAVTTPGKEIPVDTENGHSWQRAGFKGPADKTKDDPATGWVVTEEPTPDSDDPKDAGYKTTSGTGHYECTDCHKKNSDDETFKGPNMFDHIYRFKTAAKIYMEPDKSSTSWPTTAKQQLRFYSWDTGKADHDGTDGAKFMKVWYEAQNTWAWVDRNEWVFEEFKSKAK